MQSCMVALHSNIASVPGLLLTVYMYVGTEARIYMFYVVCVSPHSCKSSFIYSYNYTVRVYMYSTWVNAVDQSRVVS